MTNNAKTIVFCVANSGTGKTFTGDYLETVHGYTHVDGDLPIRNSHIPKYKALLDQIIVLFSKYINEVGPDELWQPYMGEIARMAVEAAKNSDKVVLTFACLHQEWRDFIMNILKDGLSEEDNVSMLYLTIDEDVKLEGLYYRTKRGAEVVGLTISDYVRTCGWDPDGEGDISVEEFKKFSKNTPGQLGYLVCDDPPSHAKVVDVTGRDVTALDGVDKALGLGRDPNLSYEEIIEKVLAVDHKRDEAMAEHFDEDAHNEAMAKMNNMAKEKSEIDDEIKQIKKRRSSLMKIDEINRKFSATRISDASNVSNNSRRQSLIMTGKIFLL